MKKIMFPILLAILFVIGCENTMNTPTMKIENFFSKYQKMDKEVLEELDYLLEKEKDMTAKQKEKYKSLLERQYQNLSYKITNEEIIKNKAVVDIEVEVLNYRDAINNAKEYYLTYPEQFLTEEEYLDYKLEEISKVQGLIKYKMIINLEKKNNIWEIEDLTNEDRQKIHGLY